MPGIVECVPNFSEGRRPEILDAIIGAALKENNVILLDKEMDADHNRAVVTFVGEPDAVSGAVFEAIRKAAELLDMRTHSGEHPRMGATDVVPFVPITAPAVVTPMTVPSRSSLNPSGKSSASEPLTPNLAARPAVMSGFTLRISPTSSRASS